VALCYHILSYVDAWYESVGYRCNVLTACFNTDAVVQEIETLVKEKREAKIRNRKLEALDKATSSTSSKVSKGIQQALPVMFNNKKAVDESVSRAFYSAGIPFNVDNSKHFKQALEDVSKFGPGYTPPSCDKFTIFIEYHVGVFCTGVSQSSGHSGHNAALSAHCLDKPNKASRSTS